jgi:putative transposase
LRPAVFPCPQQPAGAAQTKLVICDHTIDITYVRLHGGFIYLVAVMDWFSRYVLSWAVSIIMDVGFCLEALEQALGVATPHIFNSDQDSQFTSLEFTGRLAAAGIHISMDGWGRALDNVFVERLWRTVKYEEIPNVRL